MGKTILQALYGFAQNNDDMCIFVSDFSDNTYDMIKGKTLDMLLTSDKEPLRQLCDNDRIHPADRVIITEMCSEFLDSKNEPLIDDRYSISFRVDISKDAEANYKWCTAIFVLNKDENGGIETIVCNIRLMNSAEILNRTILDSFTNDKHPQVFSGRAQNIIQKYDKVAFIQFDIEKFKLINVKYGEEKGTEILRFINNGLDGVCSEDQVHIRLTADVFMVAMGYEDAGEVTDLIEKIQRCLGHYEDIKYKLVFGVNLVTDKSIPIRKNGDRAALARQSMKGNALNNIGYYRDEQESSLISRRFIEERMYYALEHGEFVMYLQPKYSISTERIVGSEALVRWLHPEKGMISPMEFIPVFEKNGFIIKLDEYMWEQACKAIRRWIDMGVEPYPISVNISRVHLTDDSFIDVLDGLIEKYDIPKRLLETEITETVENDNTEKLVRDLKKRGYVLLMDDFGSGYSSLNMLKNTSFDVIKIDRQFFSEFMVSNRGKKIIAHTIDMSKDIGLGMVAEGVETKEQSEFLKECGCDVAQGFYYSRPIPQVDFDKLVYGRNFDE